jgi:hypothetical protein
LGTQETFCIIIAGLPERDSFDLFLPEFDKPWVIYLRETCCCSTNLCTWRLNTVYKNRCMRRHQLARGEGEAGLPNQLRRDILLQGGDGDHFYTEETNDKLGNGLEFFFEQMDSRYGAIS